VKFLTRNIWVLSIISLFNDIASEMLYPVMPVYLKSIGFSIVLIGVLEGVAEATAGLSKGYFGNLSDNSGKRLPFVRSGYAFSAISKPMMAVFSFPLWIFAARTMDKFGKGVRTAARDALLSDEATPETKGRVFGFHRAMDTFGAVIGPACALTFLIFYPGHYTTLFYITFLPGIATILCTYLIKEKTRASNGKPRPRFLDFIKYWKTASPDYRKLAGALLLFTLFNSSDVFLLLKIKENGASDEMVIGVYIFYNIIYALFSFPMGIMADKVGMKPVLASGFIVFALVYAGMAVADTTFSFFVLFFFYGVYAAATEGIAKAWISNISDKKETATAIGTFTAFQSLATLIASSLAGFIWYSMGANTTFLLTGAVSLIVGLYIFSFKN
jgi:MFS family permease